jgi:hypothetical protein
MRYLKTLIPVLLVLALVSCAKVPQADIDAAKAAVNAVTKNADVAAYAPDSLKAATDKVAALDAEVNAQAKKGALSRNFDKVKSLITEAKTAADKAKTDAGKNKERVKAEAGDLINAMAKNLPEIEKSVKALSKKLSTSQLKDINTQLANGKTAITDAAKQLESGNYAAAKALALSVQQNANELQATLAALQSPAKK